jgi:glycosyltransferase involved in cell wall biosynthesis
MSPERSRAAVESDLAKARLRLRDLFALAAKRAVAKYFLPSRSDGRPCLRVPGNPARPRAWALLAYIPEVFRRVPADPWFRAHANRPQTLEVVRTFQGLGYAVDCIDHRDTDFQPSRHYDVVLGHEPAFPAVARRLPASTKKIYYATTLPWYHLNAGQLRFHHELATRRNIHLAFRPAATAHDAWTWADAVFYMGNELSERLHREAGTPPERLFRIANGVDGEWEYPGDKDFTRARSSFAYVGSWGPVMRGLDRLLEIFATLPQLNLHVCCDLLYNVKFGWHYRRELFGLPNVASFGFLDVASPTFREVLRRCAWQVYPSSSEAAASSVVYGMRAGLIPIVSAECTVETGGHGFVLDDCSIDALRAAVLRAAGTSEHACRGQAVGVAAHAESTYSAAAFQRSFAQALTAVLGPGRST